MYIGFTGSHGTGKTTKAYKRAYEEKLRNAASSVGFMSDVGRRCPFPRNEHATRESQLWMFNTQICGEMEAMSIHDIVVSDRTCIDAIGYTMANGYSDLADAMVSIARLYCSIYDELIMPTLDRNGYLYGDGIRSTDLEYAMKVEQCIIEAHRAVGTYRLLRFI